MPTSTDISRYGRQLGEHGEHAVAAHVPGTLIANNNATNHGQTVDLAATKSNDLYGGGNVPRLDGPKKFRWSSKGHMYDNSSGNSTAVNNGVTNDDGDLISVQHVGRVPSAFERRQW